MRPQTAYLQGGMRTGERADGARLPRVRMILRAMLMPRGIDYYSFIIFILLLMLFSFC